MINHDGYPRRKRGGAGRESEPGLGRPEPAPGGANRESLDIASYVSDMSAQLETMAIAANLDLLAYFLGMARSEADLFLRTNSGVEDEADGDDAGLADEAQAKFRGPDT